MKKFSYFLVIVGLVMMLFACSKSYEAPVFWDIKINQSGDTLTGVAYNSKSTNLSYIWHINGAKSTGKSVTMAPGRNDVQLSVLDDKGNSRAEYLIVNR